MTTAFVDESKRGRYTMVAVLVASADLADVRRQLRQLIPKGQRRIHFTSDSPQTRRRVLRAVVAMPVQVLVVEGPTGVHERDARRSCIEEIAAWVPTGARVLLEIDQGIVDADRAVLDAASRRFGFTYGHMTPHSDPGLWLPDALAWSWTRGGEWRETVRAVVASSRTLE